RIGEHIDRIAIDVKVALHHAPVPGVPGCQDRLVRGAERVAALTGGAERPGVEHDRAMRDERTVAVRVHPETEIVLLAVAGGEDLGEETESPDQLASDQKAEAHRYGRDREPG